MTGRKDERKKARNPERQIGRKEEKKKGRKEESKRRQEKRKKEGWMEEQRNKRNKKTRTPRMQIDEKMLQEGSQNDEKIEKIGVQGSKNQGKWGPGVPPRGNKTRS